MAHYGHNRVASSQKALMLELKSLQDEPVEGFKITLVDESDLYNWEVAIFGPPNTHYEGGYFKVSSVYYLLMYVNLTSFIWKLTRNVTFNIRKRVCMISVNIVNIRVCH